VLTSVVCREVLFYTFVCITHREGLKFRKFQNLQKYRVMIEFLFSWNNCFCSNFNQKFDYEFGMQGLSWEALFYAFVCMTHRDFLICPFLLFEQVEPVDDSINFRFSRNHLRVVYQMEKSEFEVFEWWLLFRDSIDHLKCLYFTHFWKHFSIAYQIVQHWALFYAKICKYKILQYLYLKLLSGRICIG
jgi:hypothetical protein